MGELVRIGLMSRMLRRCFVVISSFCGVVVMVTPGMMMAATSNPSPSEGSPKVFEQAIPLSILRPDNNEVQMVRARVTALPTSGMDQNEDVTIDLDRSSGLDSRELVLSQAWTAALGGALAAQQPWSRTHWVISNLPGVDGPASATSLALGFIAVTARIPYPNDVLVLACLYPDTSVGPVNQITKRINSAKNAGIKKIVFSSLQRFEVVNGTLFNVGSYSQGLGIEPIFVDSLSEASERVLSKSFPVIADVRKPVLSTAVSSLLDQSCRNEMAEIQKTQGAWVKDPEASSLMNVHEKATWKEIYKNYGAGIDAYRAGQLSVSYEKLRKVNAGLQTLAAIRRSGTVVPVQPSLLKVGALRKRIAGALARTDLDQNELQSALLLAERNQWLHELDSRLEGAQFLAQQAFDSRSQATQEQKDEASFKLLSSIQEVEYLLKKEDFYSDLANVVSKKRRPPVEARLRTWLPQITPIYMSAAEFLPHGLEKFTNVEGDKLMWDDRLISQIRLLHDTREEWQKQSKNLVNYRQPPASNDAQVGFVPGVAVSPIPAPSRQNSLPRLSDTAKMFDWANQYCEVVTLQRKYIGYDDLFQPGTPEVSSKGALQNMHQIADLNAKAGISLAERGGVDPSVLILIYQKANYLKDSSDPDDLLEATQAYWRCSLLGDLCWQLGYKTIKPQSTIVAEHKNPGVSVPPATSATQASVASFVPTNQVFTPVSQSTNIPIRTSAPVDRYGENSLANRDLPVPTEPTPKTTSTYPSAQIIDRTPYIESRPPSVPALPVSADEDDHQT